MLGIDVGNGNLKVDWGTDGYHFPSRVKTIGAASPTSDSPSGDRYAAQLDQVLVTVDGQQYFVGPDTHVNVEEPDNNDDYSVRPEYKALVIGALYYMFRKAGSVRKEIPHLVLGLPMSTFKVRRDDLQRIYQNCVLRVPVPDQLAAAYGHSADVRVGEVEVVPQPVGALLTWAHESNQMASLAEGNKNLVLDPGERTFDWYASNGTKPIYDWCGAIHGGRSAVVFDLARHMTETLGTHISYATAAIALQREQLAIPRVSTMIDTAPFRAYTRRIADSIVSQLTRRLPEQTFDNVVLTGGALDIFGDPLRERWPVEVIRTVRQPVMANAVGFRIWGALD